MTKKFSNEEFIKKVSKIHNNFYDYSKTIYTGYRNKIIITDPLYGDFEQLAGTHMKGSGHPKRGNNTIMELSEFLSKANKIHNNLYDYSCINYIDNKTPICIIDPEYGKFWQTPNSHLNGRGNIIRGRKTHIEKIKSNTTEFIESSKKIHGDMYDYSEVEYINSHTKVLIKDEKYGDFWQTPNSHLNGNGNPARIKIGDKKYAYINGIYDEEDNLISIKYGIETRKNSRVKKQSSQSVYQIKTIETFYFQTSSKCINAEKECINLFQRMNQYCRNSKGYIEYIDMNDGWSETTSPVFINLIKEIYTKHDGVKI